ncbi:serine O-acetyltransferase [Escherichia coli]|uniref:serine O-acetyltransferase n=1 Tax=Escherichia coli TaxID=562 RepID=UPI0003916928|nr:serine acetyltransferase [Escherichia coli]AUY97502.1 serine acetyltransferase [Escherichia coli]EEV7391977.1 serine acetyltransferase [Escherichia coli]EFA3444221.1 serine acetyltransferase [Escherichia coli]EFA9260427.1 serine acetyltransferase [Escherichia coli]EFK1996806.1 serine acetyltransferase [Escherichia coli]
MSVFSCVIKDVKRYDQKVLYGFVIALTKIGFWAVLNYRLGKLMREQIKIPILKQILWLLTGLTRLVINIITGIDIPYSANIGGGFKICHFGTIFISSKVVIGDNCTIHQGVTIGKGGHNTETDEPVIGNDVFIGANATVIGAITIGSRVRIGSNVCCYKSINDDMTVVANRIRVIKHENSSVT